MRAWSPRLSPALARISNEYALLLPGEDEALADSPRVLSIDTRSVKLSGGAEGTTLNVGQHSNGWVLLAVLQINGVETAVFERSVTHRGVIVYMTERGGIIARIPKYIGDLSKVRPRPITATGSQRLRRPEHMMPGPDKVGDTILRSDEDPCYENVAACGEEYIGWSLVSAEGAGPQRSVYLEADGKSREPRINSQESFAPDLDGPLFNPEDFFPFSAPERYAYVPGYSKRTLLGGFLPVANTAVWNPQSGGGYEVIMLLPNAPDSHPIARIRIRLTSEDEAREGKSGTLLRDPQGHAYREHHWNCSADYFYSSLAGVWNHWHGIYEDVMPVDIPDGWLLDAARAGITLSRCSYRGLEPTYQVGEGAYTKIPERSHALFPVAFYEYVWAHQLWGLAENGRAYQQNYLDKYVLPDGNFLYNTQDQTEAPLNVGLFLWNAARDYRYTGDRKGFLNQCPVLERMLKYVLQRYEYGKRRFTPEDRRYGLIWGSPEADLGDPGNDSPDSHPWYYQNAACVWRGLHEYAQVLTAIGSSTEVEDNPELAANGKRYASLAEEMRVNIQRSIDATIAASNPEMRSSGITPFEPNDTARKPTDLLSYENHRFMMDWFLADWGVPSLDEGHLKHRAIAGQQICGLHTDGLIPRTSNFMEHGTLAAKIRRDDYRSYLLTLYSLVCFAADSGNRYSPEDAYIPGSYPGEQSKYGWSAVINSTLQPALGLRWLLCYEESDRPVCHLQKAAPKHWFKQGKRIHVERCPTRFGQISWTTEAVSDRSWRVTILPSAGFSADLRVHVHPDSGAPLRGSSEGSVQESNILLPAALLHDGARITLTVTA